ncbi:hypothetical protein INH39_25365 [Massilia violaceinigra]|uniref:DNA-binding protein n=1 Tax=Massilia violaceinigra TaxID=2045208 RepID=A0ABY4A3K1_9BURK|nr:hypothetical protein [Massilia violaceinigra]UOD28740.1 hypothetical protein INH39_25365 [Massilia violaceinigra]
MSAEEMLEQLVARLASQPAPLPVQIDVWDIAHISRYLKRTADTVRREVVVHPTFPKAIRLPGSPRGQALYKAREVVAWTERLAS